MIDSITKTPILTGSLSDYFNYIIEYENGGRIQSKQLVAKESFVRLKVRVEYKKDILASYLPTVTKTLNLGFTVNFNNTTCPGCIWLQPSAYVYLTDVGDNAPSYSANEDCGWWHSGSPNFRDYQLNQMLKLPSEALFW